MIPNGPRRFQGGLMMVLSWIRRCRRPFVVLRLSFGFSLFCLAQLCFRLTFWRRQLRCTFITAKGDRCCQADNVRDWMSGGEAFIHY